MAQVIPVIALVASVAAAGVSAVGAMSAARNQEKLAEYNAANALAAGKAEAARSEQETRRRLASAAAAYGAAGVEMEGTPLEVMSDLATQGALDRQTILWNARQQAAAGIFEGQSQAAASRARGYGTILTGVSQAGGMAYDYWGSDLSTPKSPLGASSREQRGV